MRKSSEKVILLGLACYHDTGHVGSFIDHVRNAGVPEGWRIEIAIADNCGSLASSPAKTGDVCVCEPGSNLGYLGGCAYAIGEWQKRYEVLPKWTVIANTDIRFGKEFFTRLISFRLPEGVAVLAPDITLQNGLHQNPYRVNRPSRIEMYLYTLIYRSSLLTRSMDLLKYALCNLGEKMPRASIQGDASPKIKDRKQKEQIIYAPHGSCILFHETFFEKGGALGFEGFMYGEEIYIAEEARLHGLKIAWIPQLQVMHFQKASTGRVYHAQKRLWRYESAKVLWNKYFS